MPIRKNISAFSLKHMFAVVGFFCTAIAIIALTIFYRDMIVKDIVLQGERQNQLLAQTALNSVHSELIAYLQNVNDIDNTRPDKYAVPPKLEETFQSTLSNIYVARINIYSMDGTVVYSTRNKKIVRDRDNRGFISAIAGKVFSKLEYRDIFTLFDKESELDNLVESYLPVRAHEDSPILGVFEIYTDVSPIVKEIEHTEIMIILGVIVILLLLYGLLMAIVRRVASTLENQQSVIQERTKTLELLSSQLINAQEDEKKGMARELHENIAQSLACVKNVIESALAKQSPEKDCANSELKQSIKIIQDSIGEIRALAMVLRPPSLDDFGLVKTLNWLCGQYRLLYPHVEINTSFNLNESEISDAHKSIIYRVAQDTLASITREGIADVINIGMSKEMNSVTLMIEDNSDLPDDFSQNPSQAVISKIPLYTMQKRTMLSGGVFSIEKKRNGAGAFARSSWQMS